MNKKPHWALWLGLAIVVAGLLPILVYWRLFQTVPTVTADEAKALLAKTNAPVLLVDVRSPRAFDADHLPGAVNWPMEQAGSPDATKNWVVPNKDTKVLVVCDSGLMSAQATRHLQHRFGSARFCNVAGGMMAWHTVSGGKCIALNARHMGTAEQSIAAVTAFGIKPLYMLLTLAWIIWLWRRAEPDLAALRWGLILFWLGENACSVNYLFFSGFSDLWEFFHNYGMAVGFGFVVWAILEALDRRVLRLSPPKERCALLSLCKDCIKYAPVPCKAQQVFKWLLPAAIVVAALPLFAEIKPVSYNARVFDSVENYSLMASSQLFESRYCPILALLLLTGSWLVMLIRKDDPVPLAKVLFAAALGLLGFGFMRLFLSSAFAENLVWYVAWEEWTELLFIVAIGVVLWLFRHTLLMKPTAAADAGVNALEPA